MCGSEGRDGVAADRRRRREARRVLRSPYHDARRRQRLPLPRSRRAAARSPAAGRVRGSAVPGVGAGGRADARTPPYTSRPSGCRRTGSRRGSSSRLMAASLVLTATKAIRSRVRRARPRGAVRCWQSAACSRFPRGHGRRRRPCVRRPRSGPARSWDDYDIPGTCSPPGRGSSRHGRGPDGPGRGADRGRPGTVGARPPGRARSVRDVKGMLTTPLSRCATAPPAGAAPVLAGCSDDEPTKPPVRRVVEGRRGGARAHGRHLLEQRAAPRRFSARTPSASGSTSGRRRRSGGVHAPTTPPSAEQLRATSDLLRALRRRGAPAGAHRQGHRLRRPADRAHAALPTGPRPGQRPLPRPLAVRRGPAPGRVASPCSGSRSTT